MSANVGTLATVLKMDTGGAQASMQGLAQVSVAEFEKIKRQAKYVQDQLKALTGAQQQANNSASMAKATQEMVKYGQAAEMSARQMAFANRMMPAQITDIVTSLASGQNAFTVLIQQGGQIKDMYGGVGNAARALVSALNPARIAFGALGLAVGSVVVGLTQGRKEFGEFQRQILNTGGAASVTADQVNGMAAALNSATSATRGKASEVLTGLVSGGGVSRAQLLQATQASIAAERALGIEAEKTAQAFASLGKEPLDAAVKLNEKYNFLTVATYKQIKALNDQKRDAEAAAVAQEAFAQALIQRAGEMEKNLGAAEKAWRGLGDAAKWAWDKILNVGRTESLSEQLARVQSALADSKKGGWFGIDLRSESQRAGQIQDLKDSEDAIREQMRMAQRAANARAVEAEAVKAMAKADKERVKAQKESREFVGPPTFDEMYPAANVGAIMKQQQDNMSARALQAAEERKAYEQIRQEEGRARVDEMERNAAEAKKNMERMAKEGQEQVKYLEDSIMLVVRKGKDGFADLFRSMAEEAIRNMIRIAAQKMLLDKNGGFSGWGQAIGMIGSFFGGGSGWGADSSTYVPSSTGEFSGGLEYVPYDGFPAILHKGERVQRSIEASADRSGGSGKTVQIDASVNVQNGDIGANVLRIVRANQSMQAAKLASATRY